MTNDGNNSERSWLYNHKAEYAELMDFINKNPNCNEANEFANQMLGAMRSSPNYHFNVKVSAKSPANIDLTDVQDNSPAAIKFRCIYDKLTKSSEFKKLFIDMFQDNTRPNVKFKIADLLGNQNGGEVGTTVISSTNPFDNSITIDKDLLENGNVMAILKTILHECIHAYLNVKLADPTIGMSIPNLNNMDVQDCINSYYPGFSTGGLQAQHSFIFNYMMNTMCTVLGEIKDSVVTPEQNAEIQSLTLHINQNTNPITNTDVPWSWNEYYKNLSLDGLQNCPAFQSEIATVVNNMSTNVVNENRWSTFIQYKNVAYSQLPHACNN